jgi:hypothetical protein
MLRALGIGFVCGLGLLAACGDSGSSSTGSGTGGSGGGASGTGGGSVEMFSCHDTAGGEKCIRGVEYCVDEYDSDLGTSCPHCVAFDSACAPGSCDCVGFDQTACTGQFGYKCEVSATGDLEITCDEKPACGG